MTDISFDDIPSGTKLIQHCPRAFKVDPSAVTSTIRKFVALGSGSECLQYGVQRADFIFLPSSNSHRMIRFGDNPNQQSFLCKHVSPDFQV